MNTTNSSTPSPEKGSENPPQGEFTSPGLYAQIRASQEDTPEIPLGQEINNRLVLQSLLGRGGMGAVFLAYDKNTKTKKALKFLLDESEDRELQRRFEREAQIASQMVHPNIIHCFGMGEFEGKPYIEMEYVQGQSLKELIETKGTLDPQWILDIIGQTASALEEAHRKGIFHRDIKPDNIMISDKGGVKIADFGLAKDLNVTAMTKTGTAMGTATYMSPEQVKGEKVDAGADIYSLGATLYHAVVGKAPFEGKVMEILQQVVTKPVSFPQDTSHLSTALKNLIKKMMKKDRQARLQTMREVLKEIEKVYRVLKGEEEEPDEEIQDTPLPFYPPEETQKIPSSLPLILVIIGLTIALILVVVFGIMKAL